MKSQASSSAEASLYEYIRLCRRRFNGPGMNCHDANHSTTTWWCTSTVQLHYKLALLQVLVATLVASRTVLSRPTYCNDREHDDASPNVINRISVRITLTLIYQFFENTIFSGVTQGNVIHSNDLSKRKCTTMTQPRLQRYAPVLLVCHHPLTVFIQGNVTQ